MNAAEGPNEHLHARENTFEIPDLSLPTLNRTRPRYLNKVGQGCPCVLRLKKMCFVKFYICLVYDVLLKVHLNALHNNLLKICPKISLHTNSILSPNIYFKDG